MDSISSATKRKSSFKDNFCWQKKFIPHVKEILSHVLMTRSGKTHGFNRGMRASDTKDSMQKTGIKENKKEERGFLPSLKERGIHLVKDYDQKKE